MSDACIGQAPFSRMAGLFGTAPWERGLPRRAIDAVSTGMAPATRISAGR